jgi:GNAT superfamily N-acetyltransferase
MTDAPPPQRIAVAADIPAIRELMHLSAQALFPAFYDHPQAVSGAVHLAHLDTLLVHDGTYFVHEHDGELVACGGWSRRAKLYAGGAVGADDDRLLDPAAEAARVRAMFVRADWTRRRLGFALLRSSERAAAAEGFRELVLVAALPGVPLYRADGFAEVERLTITMPDGVQIAGVEMRRPVSPTLLGESRSAGS